jgi:hypothetical protein
MIPPKSVDKITWRKWRDLDWRHPQLDLYNLGKLQADLEAKGFHPTTDDLRQRELKAFLERKQAALFSFFISYSVLRAPILYAMSEDRDYDCVLRWTAEGQRRCVPVQLKEIVPLHLNSTATIESELAKLEKYATSPSTIVAVHLNREGPMEYSAIKKPHTSVGEIWLYASIAADQSLWFLYGDLLGRPRGYEIPWPTTDERPIYAP